MNLKFVALLLVLSPVAVNAAGPDRKLEIECRADLAEDLGRKPSSTEVKECVRDAKQELYEQGQEGQAAMPARKAGKASKVVKDVKSSQMPKGDGWFTFLPNGLGRNWNKSAKDGWMQLLNGPKNQDAPAKKQ